jgi:hypothetical protein
MHDLIHLDFRGIYFLHCLFESKQGHMGKKMMNSIPQAAQHMSFKQKLKRWVGKHPVLWAFLLIVVLWKGFWWHFNTPIKNPWPEHPYTIKGRFPFDKGFDIVLEMNVIGEAGWHQWVCGGANITYASCRSGIVYFSPQKVDGYNYKFTAYKDYYFKGLPFWSEPRFFDGVSKFDPKTLGMISTPLLSGVPIICDDSAQGVKKLETKERCRPQYFDEHRQVGYEKYKHLVLPPSGTAGPNEQVMDFWLTSELDEMLKTQPAPISDRPQP